MRFRVLRLTILPIAYMGLLYYLSSIPGNQGDEDMTQHLLQWVSPNVQNLLHIPLYALLAWLWCRALGAWPMRVAAIAPTALLVTITYGAFNEWQQIGVPGRYPSFTDVLLNGFGGGVGSWFYLHQKAPFQCS